MRRLSAFSILIGSALVGFMVVSCTMIISPTPVEDAKAQTLEALNALQTAWQQEESDAAALQSYTVSLRERLTILCSPYLPLAEQVETTTTPLTARQAPTQVVPQSATPSEERPSPEGIQEREEALDQTQRAPDPAVLQERRMRLAAIEGCQRAMELLTALDDTLAAQDVEARTLANILTELREVVEQLPEAPLP